MLVSLSCLLLQFYFRLAVVYPHSITTQAVDCRPRWHHHLRRVIQMTSITKPCISIQKSWFLAYLTTNCDDSRKARDLSCRQVVRAHPNPNSLMFSTDYPAACCRAFSCSLKTFFNNRLQCVVHISGLGLLTRIPTREIGSLLFVPPWCTLPAERLCLNSNSRTKNGTVNLKLRSHICDNSSGRSWTE